VEWHAWMRCTLQCSFGAWIINHVIHKGIATLWFDQEGRERQIDMENISDHHHLYFLIETSKG